MRARIMLLGVPAHDEKENAASATGRRPILSLGRRGCARRPCGRPRPPAHGPSGGCALLPERSRRPCGGDLPLPVVLHGREAATGRVAVISFRRWAERRAGAGCRAHLRPGADQAWQPPGGIRSSQTPCGCEEVPKRARAQGQLRNVSHIFAKLFYGQIGCRYAQKRAFKHPMSICLRFVRRDIPYQP